MAKYDRVLFNGEFSHYALSGTGATWIEQPDHPSHQTMLEDIANDPACIADREIAPVSTVDELRIAAYGSIGDQLDEIYHDIDAWRARIAGVKAANPKGEG
jgi:hypothetical protein